MGEKEFAAALVARGSVPLVTHVAPGRAALLRQAETLLASLPTYDVRASQPVPGSASLVFHYAIERGLTFLVCAPETLKKRAPFALIDEVRGNFTRKFPGAADSLTAAACASFQGALADACARFGGEVPAGDKIAQTRAEVEKVKSAMIGNIDQLADRGEKLTNVVARSEALAESATQFKRSATSLKNEMWWKNVKLIIIIVVIVLVVLVIIVVPIALKASGKI